MVKTFEINLYEFIKKNNLKTKMIMPIHDEIIFSVPYDEEKYVKDFKNIMEDTLDVIKNIPMVASVDMSETNWRDKKEYEFSEDNLKEKYK